MVLGDRAYYAGKCFAARRTDKAVVGDVPVCRRDDPGRESAVDADDHGRAGSLPDGELPLFVITNLKNWL